MPLPGLNRRRQERWRCALLFAAIACVTPPCARAQDAVMGEQVFRSKCSLCHSPRPGRNLIGPSLFGVVGRHSGQVPGFGYSSANRQSGLTWDPATLDRYLTKPSQVVPGTLMTFPGLRDPTQRAAVIAYLATLR
jgi:cytochrome c2